ncbi:hypothetical protein BC941DRAFT_432609, partial [Chlamydoabsidia padenii]
MCDLNWCPFCDKAIAAHCDSLYCSEQCMHLDTTNGCGHLNQICGLLKSKRLVTHSSSMTTHCHSPSPIKTCCHSPSHIVPHRQL